MPGPAGGGAAGEELEYRPTCTRALSRGRAQSCRRVCRSKSLKTPVSETFPADVGDFSSSEMARLRDHLAQSAPSPPAPRRSEPPGPGRGDRASPLVPLAPLRGLPAHRFWGFCGSLCLGSHLRRTLPGRSPWAPPCWQNNNFIDSGRHSHRQAGAEPGWRRAASSPTPQPVGRGCPRGRPRLGSSAPGGAPPP